MNAYEIMRGWDIEAGIQPRSDQDLAIDVAGSGLGPFDLWVEALEAGDPEATAEGRKMWGLVTL